MEDILFQNVSFSYPDSESVLEHIDLTIDSGEQIALIGHNGAGKSTLAKLINRLLSPTDGNVWIGDMNTKEYTTAKIAHHVGYVFQNPDDQIFHPSVEKEVGFCRKIVRQKGQNVKAQIDAALHITGMEKYRTKNPFELPLSLRRFVAMASVLAMDPDIFIFDEPTAGQDLAGRNTLINIFRELKEKKKTVIVISHDMEFVFENFDKFIIMANKGILFFGTRKEAFQTPHLFKKAGLEPPSILRLCRYLDIDAADVETAARQIYGKWADLP